MDSKTNSHNTGSGWRNAVIVALLLSTVLALLFRQALMPGHTLFSNDGPLGTLMSQSHDAAYTFSGGWQDLNTLGFRESGALANITYGILLVLGPTMFSKVYAPMALLILGFSAWVFFRQMRFSPAACVLGALAATLNSSFFSAASWGVAAHPITIGMSFLALAAVAPTAQITWLRAVLAGFAVGMGVMEGADIGAIFSIFVAIFIVYQAWITEGPRSRNLMVGFAKLGTVAIAAGFIAAQTVMVLVATQIQGVAGTSQDTQTKEQRWDWATQWSLPKQEALSFLVPGLFGYRMDTPQNLSEGLQKTYVGGNYWGAVGRDPNWDRYFAGGKQGSPPGGFMRFTGGGIYSGVLVILVAFWAALQSFRKQDSIFTLPERRWILFWAAVAFISLLLSFGRFAPFYQFLYMLPYFSTIRNPAKFTHVVNWALVILFAYGVNGLWRHYVSVDAGMREGFGARVKKWWSQLRGFDRKWVFGMGAFLGVAVLSWLIYASSKQDLVRHLQEVQFGQEMAEVIAGFSIRQVGYFVVFLALAIALLVLVMSKTFAGNWGKWAGVALGLFLVVDLGRANVPWVIAWDYKQKYATNPILDKLRDKAYLQRVAILPGWIGDSLRAPPELDLIDQLYRIEWAQHHFLYYNIHSLDVVQMPRMPADLLAFETALQPRAMTDIPVLVPRKWELTSTRYLLGPAGFVPFLNQQLDPGKGRFRIAEQFEIVPKPGISQPTRLEELTALPSTNGNFALIEFTGALPRAKLYSQWQVFTNEQAVLQRMVEPGFDAHQTVLVSAPAPTAPDSAVTNAGSVSFVSYAPKDIVLKAEVLAPSILLLNDRYDANWNVYVDGRKETLLRCNSLMRGVHLQPGTHEVAFRFEPPTTWFYVSLAAVGIALLLTVALVTFGGNRPAPAERPPSVPVPGKKQ